MKKAALFFCLGISLTIQGQTYLDTAVNFTATDIEGYQHDLYTYLDQGKFVVLDFFYTTCNPCIGSIPFLNEAFQNYGCNQGEVVFLSINFGDSVYDIQQYQQTYGALLPAIGGYEGGNVITSLYGIVAFPTVILIAPDREILNQDIFPVTTENLEFALGDQAGLLHQPEWCMVSGNQEAGLEAGGLQLHPNPAQEEVFVSWLQDAADVVIVRLYDWSGQLVFQTDLGLAMPGQHQAALSISSLPSGMYWLVLGQGQSRQTAALQIF